jgi:hypothetical protein
MTVSSHFGVEQTLQLLESLQGTVNDFAAREEKLNQELRSRTSAVRYRRDAEIEELTTRLTEEVAQADASFRAAREAAASAHRKRKAWIIEAHRTSKKKALEGIENQEGRRKHKLQTETLQTKRNRETGLASAETALAEFKSALATEHEALLSLETSARRAFK